MSTGISILNGKAASNSDAPQILFRNLQISLPGDEFKKNKIDFAYLYQGKKAENVKLFIKYMVSLRCKMVVKEELKKLGLQTIAVDLGMVELLGDITTEQHD